MKKSDSKKVLSNMQSSMRNDLVFAFSGTSSAWMTTKQAANWYEVNDRTVRKWIAKDKVNWTDRGYLSPRYLVKVKLW